MNTYYFNGTYKGDGVQGKVTVRDEKFYNVDVVSFDKNSGEPCEQYERLVSRMEYTPRQAVRAVIRNPFNF